MEGLEGKIVEYADDDRPRIGLVVKEASEKLQLIDERGKNATVAKSKLVLVHQAKYTSDIDFVSLAKDLKSKIESAMLEVDTQLLWETVASDQREFEVRELTELYFGEYASVSASALFRVIAGDNFYFKRHGNRFSPKTPDTVREQLDRVERQRQKRLFAERAVEWIRAVVSGDGSFEVPTDLEELVNRTEAFLLKKQVSEITNLLSKVSEDLSPREVAFELLLRTGRLSETADPLLVIAGIEEHHRPDVIEAAAAVLPFTGAPDREDFSGSLSFSIDDEETEEIDDAISVEGNDTTLRIGIHIADPATFVVKGDKLDADAYKQSVTVYLPTKRVTMIPERVACDLASLREAELRPAVSFEVELDDDGTVLDSRITRGMIRVTRRLSYDDADRMMIESSEGIGNVLARLSRIAERLAEKRAENGALIIRRPELKVRVKNGELKLQQINPRSASRMIVSELMILANQIAARFAADYDIPVIYRAQDPPTEPIEESVRAALKEGYDPVAFDKLIKLIRRSKLSLFPQPHVGLGLSAYTQLTSPIRRYADLVIQRQLTAHLAGESLPYQREELLAVLATVEAAERDVRSIESRANRYWLLDHLTRQPSEAAFSATVVKRTSGGFELELKDFFTRGMVWSVQSLEIGQPVQVRVDKADPKRGLLKLRVVSTSER
jgi:exoribonuclease-2